MFGPGTKDRVSKFPPISKASSRDLSNNSIVYRYSLSELTKKENKKVLSQAEQLIKKNNSIVSTLSTQSPLNVNFDKLIDKLDVIISNNSNGKQIQLKEGLSREFILENDQHQYMKIHTRGRASPLKLNINLQRGTVETYISKFNSSPSQDNCDEMIKKTNFKIRASGSRFEYEFIYLAVYASVDSRFSIICSFGEESTVLSEIKNKPNSNDFNKKLWEKLTNSGLTDRIDKIDKFENSSRIEKSVPKIDYVKMNMVSHIQTTEALKNKYSKNIKNWDKKRKNAMAKKELIAKEKHESLVHMMHQRRIKYQEEKQRQALAKEKSCIQFFQASLLTVAHIFKAVNTFKEILDCSRFELAANKTSHNAALLIQRQFKNIVIPCGMRKCNMIKVKTNLLLWANCFPSQNTNLSSFVATTGANAKIPLVFVAFESKVLKIQGAWRRYTIRMRIFWKKLVVKWGVVLGTLIEKCDLSQKKSEQIKASKYFKISSYTRDQVLSKYVWSRKEKFRTNLSSGKPQKLRIIPTDKHMIHLIKSIK